VCAERCELLPLAKERRGRSEPVFLLYKVRAPSPLGLVAVQ